MFQKKNIYDIINKRLTKKGHDLIMSIFLENYNNYNIYIRFDYDKTIQAYKICWYDMDFIDKKNIENYTNSQLMTKNLGLKMDRILGDISLKNTIIDDENIIGDRIEVLFKNKEGLKEYTFSRFLPKKYKQLAEPIVIAFSYLPRGMEGILQEILAPFNNMEEYYNSIKPFRFNIENGDENQIFRKDVIERGTKFYEEGNIAYLEHIQSRYISVVNMKKPYVVTIKQINPEFVSMSCSCASDHLCKQEYAVLKAIRNKQFNSFYKVQFSAKEETLLERVTNGSFSLCCGVEKDCLLIVTIENELLKVPILLNGKKCFKIIEDDEDLTLSKYFEKL